MGKKIFDESTLKRVVADWRTGEYSQRDLAAKYKMSPGYVAKICKGAHKDCEQVVSAGLVYKQGLASVEPEVASAIDNAVSNKLRIAGMVNSFVEKAINRASQLLDDSPGGFDLKALTEAVDRVSITAGINERHAKPSIITNASQTNIDVGKLSGMTEPELRAHAKKLADQLVKNA